VKIFPLKLNHSKSTFRSGVIPKNQGAATYMKSCRMTWIWINL